MDANVRGQTPSRTTAGGRSEQRVQALIREHEPTVFPDAIQRALGIVRDSDSSAEEIRASLQEAPALSQRILKVVNSPGFGLRHTVDDIAHACTLMGRATLESFLITAGVREAIPRKLGRGFDPRRYWQAAARRASVARTFGAEFGEREVDALFTGALLHDVAVPLLRSWLSEDYGRLLDRWHRGDAELHELERSTFGWDHAAVGAALCELWKIPQPICDVVASHHRRPDHPAPPSLANAMAGQLPEVDWHRALPLLTTQAKVQGKLDENDARRLLNRALDESTDIAERLA